MSFPNPNTFGIVDNPLVFSPYSENNFDGGVFANNDFLLLDGDQFMLLDGDSFLLLES